MGFKSLFACLFCFIAAPLFAQDTAAATPLSTPAPAPIIHNWGPETVPWDAWFKSNTMVTDKGDYVHFFWNAQDFRKNFEVKDKKKRLADAALQLVSRLYPADAKADSVKVDIVYVLERDTYGMPKWDSLQRVAHLEFSRAKSLKAAHSKVSLPLSALSKLFDKFSIF